MNWNEWEDNGNISLFSSLSFFFLRIWIVLCGIFHPYNQMWVCLLLHFALSFHCVFRTPPITLTSKITAHKHYYMDGLYMLYVSGGVCTNPPFPFFRLLMLTVFTRSDKLNLLMTFNWIDMLLLLSIKAK